MIKGGIIQLAGPIGFDLGMWTMKGSEEALLFTKGGGTQNAQGA